MSVAAPEPSQEPPASVYERAVQAAGLTLSKDARILDFCCGAGADAYRFCDRGYAHVHAYDVRDYVDRRADGPQPEFRFGDAEGGITLPFPDDYFDFIYSNQVLEHVQDLDAALSELSRCLKREGFSFHVFPSKWQPIECHIHVPFGGAITADAYFRFWAMLGIRNEYQKDKSAAETAAANIRYTRDSLNYKTGTELAALFRRHFGSFEYADIHLLKHSLGKGRWIYPIAKIFPPLLWLYRFAHMRVVLLFNGPERREPASS